MGDETVPRVRSQPKAVLGPLDVPLGQLIPVRRPDGFTPVTV